MARPPKSRAHYPDIEKEYVVQETLGSGEARVWVVEGMQCAGFVRDTDGRDHNAPPPRAAVALIVTGTRPTAGQLPVRAFCTVQLILLTCTGCRKSKL